MGRRIGYARLERVLESLKREINWGNTTTFAGTNIPKIAIVDNTTAFVRNSDSIVSWTQPQNTIIRKISLLFPSSTYSTGTGNSLGYEVGTTSGGGEIVAKAPDQIIDVGTDGTDLATGALLELTIVANTEDAVVLGVNIAYTSASRTVYLNTVETSNAAAIVTPGTARWIIEYVQFA